ncbi:MAG TPA: thiamine phosphate synthase [Thermodesulfovibrionales bacterium]|nr:thiamine phosphate synthase [Thermodesulfovibrionales bacterium]
MRSVSRPLSGLYLIVDRSVGDRAPEEITRGALKAGVRWFQYREKKAARGEIFEVALRLRRMTADFGAVLIVNDHADIAVAADADGVHLGQDDLPLGEARKVVGDRIIGISTHSLEEALEASDKGADYVGYGPVFPTKTKDAGEPKGVAMLARVSQSVSIPVVAIGGVSKENLKPVLDAGAAAVAVASAILIGDIRGNISSFLGIIGRDL